MRDIKLVKFVSFFAAFLLIFTTAISFSPVGVANGESSIEVRPPEGVGPYQVGWIDRDILKTGGGTLPVSIHYPSITPGRGAAPNITEAPYPTLLFSLGYSTTMDNYRNFASRITSWGFVFALVGSDPKAWDSERATDLIDSLNWLDQQNDNSSFKLSQIMDESKFGVLGHSLGGEATIIVSRSEPRFKVLVPIAPFISPPMTIVSLESAAAIHIPIRIVVGQGDAISPPNAMAYPLYNNGNPPKFGLTLVGADHYTAMFTGYKYIVSFLKFYLYEDQNYARYLYGADAQQDTHGGTIKLMYDLRRIIEYEVLFQGTSHTICAYSDSEFLDFSYNETVNEIDFKLTGPPYTTGTANITVPKRLAPQGYNFEVEFDGEFYPFALTNNPISYFIYLTYTHSQHQITIRFVDLTPPTLYIISPSANSEVNSSSVTVGWIGSDNASGIDHYEVKLDENSWINVGTNVSHIFTEVADGTHTICVRAVDKAGNPTEIQASFNAKTAVSAPALIWMEWWFWAIICVAVMSMVILVFHIRRRRSTTMRANI
jgi:dienelactone hydrolase